MDQVTICNMALGLLGDTDKTKRMTAFTRAGCSTGPQHACLDFYDSAKEQMHAMMDWKRTRKVKALSLSADAPLLDGKWAYKYTRPPDCFLLRKTIDTSGVEQEFDEVNEEDGAGKNIEFIYSNSDDLLAWYTILIGEERYLPGMGQLHALILAGCVAMEVTGDPKAKIALASEFKSQAKQFCMALASNEGYVENETGSRKLTDCY